jgi:type IV secretory pathway TrbL component
MSRIVWIIAAVVVIVLGYVFLTGEEEPVPAEPAVQSSTETPAEQAGDAADEAGNALDDATDAASDAAGNAVEGASDAASEASEAAGNAAEEAGDAMQNAGEDAGNAAENVQEDAGEALGTTGEPVQPEDQPTLENDVEGMSDEEAIRNGQ